MAPPEGEGSAALRHVAHFRPDFQPVTAQNVWAYFRTSPFYDFACLNEYIAMQGADESKLQTEPGVFYRVFPQAAGVFTVLRYHREVAGTRMVVTCRDGYYVFGGRIFPAPTLLDVLAKKVRNVCHQVSEAMAHADQLVTFDVPGGYRWRIDGDGDGAAGATEAEAEPSHRTAPGAVHPASAALWQALEEAVQARPPPPPAAAAAAPDLRPAKRRRTAAPLA